MTLAEINRGEEFEKPPLRLPKIGNVLRKTYIKSRSFIMEAGPTQVSLFYNTVALKEE